ncbi:hypothetical protein HanOQP8_Chr17g0678341 [Helianthus annuus]|nr:hypothetical protein HanOQP8_Chr17g0678341 [Helianthus annuus]
MWSLSIWLIVRVFFMLLLLLVSVLSSNCVSIFVNVIYFIFHMVILNWILLLGVVVELMCFTLQLVFLLNKCL